MVLTKEHIKVVLNSYRKIQTYYFCFYALLKVGVHGDYSPLANIPDTTLLALIQTQIVGVSVALIQTQIVAVRAHC